MSRAIIHDGFLTAEESWLRNIQLL